MLLLKAARDRLGEEAVKTGHHLSSFEQSSDYVDVHFTDKKTGEKLGTYQADVLIAADGIHSAARKFFYPEEGDPLFAGRILWRGVSESPIALSGASMFSAGHENQKFVAYPIGKNPDNNQLMVNWIAELAVEGNAPPRADWNKSIDRQVFAPAFSSWDFGWISVPKLIEDAEEVFEFPMVDRDPLTRWVFDRVALLGDAAHPMYPIGSNGASQAILDGEELGKAVTHSQNWEEALKAYQDARLDYTSNIIKSNRKNGPDQVMQIVEERAPNGFDSLYDVISQEELEAIANQYKQLTGFDRAK